MSSVPTELSKTQRQQQDELETYLHQLFYRYPRDLLACLVTDREGVILGKAIGEVARESLIEPQLASTFAVASEQASKLGLGRHRTLVCMTDLHQLVQASNPPLVVSLIADTQANTGQLLDLVEQVCDAVRDLAVVVAENVPA